MALKFEPVTIVKQTEYRRLVAACPQATSDYSFINLWSWADEHGLQWAWDGDLVWLRQTRPEVRWWAPVGQWDGPQWDRLLESRAGQTAAFERVPEALMKRWQAATGEALSVTETRGHWDYLYAVQDLAQLKGNRYHKKKNLLNQFRKKYDFSYRPLGPELVDRALAMQSDWCTWRDCEAVDTLASENRAIEKTLRHWQQLTGVMGGALLVDERMAAYTVAEALNDETVLIHFEKGDPEFKGAYQAINQMFVDNLTDPFRLVNREQDLDDPGLRKAKLSYHPAEFERKYRVEFG